MSCATLALIATAACGGESSTSDSTTTTTAGADSATVIVMSAAEVQHGAIRWTPADTREASGSIEAPGQLVPNEDRTARLGAPLQGRVVAVHVQAGARVGRGQPLVTLQSPEASDARAEYAKAAADLTARRSGATFARSGRLRAERLFEAMAASRQELERAQTDEALAQSELARAEAEASRTRTTLATLGIGTTDGAIVLRSPLDGVVLSREAAPGAVVAPGTPLVTVSDASSLWLEVSLPAAAASGLTIGSRVRFGVAAFPTDTFEARVVSIGGALDPQSRALPVRAAVTSTRNRLRAAMFATVWLESGARALSVVVPASSVMLLDGRSVVFVARPGSAGTVRLERRNVVLGGEQGGLVRIHTGVKPGELVVTEGAFAVKATFSRAKMAAG